MVHLPRRSVEAIIFVALTVIAIQFVNVQSQLGVHLLNKGTSTCAKANPYAPINLLVPNYLTLESCAGTNVNPNTLWQLNFTGVLTSGGQPTYQLISSGTGNCTTYWLNIAIPVLWVAVQANCDFNNLNQYWYTIQSNTNCNYFKIANYNNPSSCLGSGYTIGIGSDIGPFPCSLGLNSMLWTIKTN